MLIANLKVHTVKTELNPNNGLACIEVLVEVGDELLSEIVPHYGVCPTGKDGCPDWWEAFTEDAKAHAVGRARERLVEILSVPAEAAIPKPRRPRKDKGKPRNQIPATDTTVNPDSADELMYAEYHQAISGFFTHHLGPNWRMKIRSLEAAKALIDYCRQKKPKLWAAKGVYTPEFCKIAQEHIKDLTP